MFDLVAAVNTHYYWPDLRADLGEVLRVLKLGGKLIVIGEGYKGGKYDDRNRKWAELFGITYRRVGELGELFSIAGYSNVQMFEEYDRGWICGVGEKL